MRANSNLLERMPRPFWFTEICIDEHFDSEGHRNLQLLDTFDEFFNRSYKVVAMGEKIRGCMREENVAT